MSFDLQQVYEHEADAVCAVLSRFDLRGADLEDAMHDTFVIAAGRVTTFDASRPVRPWLLGIAFRVGVGRLRTRRVHDSKLPDDRDPAQNPERTVELNQAASLLRRALTEISEEQGTVFTLFDLQGVPMAEIAQSMGVPLQTAYSRLRLAREAVMAAVKRYERSAYAP